MMVSQSKRKWHRRRVAGHKKGIQAESSAKTYAADIAIDELISMLSKRENRREAPDRNVDASWTRMAILLDRAMPDRKSRSHMGLQDISG